MDADSEYGTGTGKDSFKGARIADVAEKEETTANPINIATISTGFEKGDFLVREEKGELLLYPVEGS